MKVNLPDVEGCKEVTIFKGSYNNERFTLLETWETKESHQKHIEHLTQNGARNFISEHLLTDPESSYYEQW